MNNEKEMQAIVRRLSNASAKKALEKEKTEVVSSAVGRAYIMPSGIPKVMATLEGKPEMTKHEFEQTVATKCVSKQGWMCSITTYACKDYLCPKLKLPKQ